MHYQGFPTSNHYGATADGLVLGYRAGASLLYQDSIQYHPTGAIYPSQILGCPGNRESSFRWCTACKRKRRSLYSSAGNP